jgi:hypothetical protein
MDILTVYTQKYAWADEIEKRRNNIWKRIWCISDIQVNPYDGNFYAYFFADQYTEYVLLNKI